MKRSFIERYDEILAELAASSVRPSLLLHVCCAPCASAVLERLVPHFAVTAFFYNPNIEPAAEFLRRRDEFARFLQAAHPDVPAVFPEHCEVAFLNAAKGFEAEKEGGARCKSCYELRLKASAEFASKNGFEFFCTTLSVSPHKNASWINEIGEILAARFGIRFLPSDFKKRDGFKRSLELSREYGLYRQDYCGCLFGKNAQDRL